MKDTSTANATLQSSSGLTEVLPCKMEGIAWCSAFTVMSVLIIIGNLFTIVTFAFKKKLRRKSLLLVVNMAFADLILGAVSVPIYMHIIAVHYQLWHESWIINEPLKIFVDFTFMQGSLISTTLIACERFSATYQPLKHRILPRRVYYIAMFAAWSLAILASGCFVVTRTFFSAKYAIIFWNIYALVLKFIVCACNIGVRRKLLNKSVASRQTNRTLQNQRLTKTLLYASIIAMVCCFPLSTTTFVNIVYQVAVPMRTDCIANFVNYSNCFLNPLVYAVRIPEFREALGLCFTRQKLTKGKADLNKGKITPVVLKQVTEKRKNKQNDCGNQQVCFEEQILDTKL